MRTGRVVALLSALALLLAGAVVVAGAGASGRARTPSATLGASSDTAQGRGEPVSSAAVGRRPLRYVVAVSVDGLSTRAIRHLGRDRLPSLHRLIRNGRATLNARTAREVTYTLPNHTGMLTGRRVLTRKGHHVTFNEDNGETLRRTSGRYVAGVFDVVHDRGGSTALYTSKDKFRYLNRSWNGRNGAPDRVGADNGRDKIDRFRLDDPGVVVGALVRRLRSQPDTFSFLHLSLPDVAGHEHGWMSAEYLAAVRRSDVLLGRVLDAVRSERQLRRHVDVILTADHGGTPGTRGHGDVADVDSFRVPFMVWGVDVRTSGGLYAVNPERRNPGGRRPTYAGRQPIRNMDVAGLTTSLLGMPRVRGGRLRGLEPLSVS